MRLERDPRDELTHDRPDAAEGGGEGESIHGRLGAPVPLPVPPEQSAELLSSFVQLMPDAGIVVDESGRIVASNQQADIVFGYAPGSVVGIEVERLIPERVRLRHRRHREGYTTSPTVRPMGKGLTLVGRRKNGTEFPVDISLAPVVGAGSTLVVASVRDVTAQHEAVAAQAELAAIVRSSGDAIISMSLQGRIASWNPGAESLFGYTPEEALGQHIQTLVPHESGEVFETLLAGAEAEEHLGARDTLWRARDGTLVDVAVSISPLKDDSGRSLGFSCVVRDVSERKRQEQELRRLLAEEERLERLHAVTAEIRLFLLSETDRAESLAMIAEHAAELLTAEVAAIFLADEDELEVVSATGPASILLGTRVPLRDAFNEFLDTGKPRSDESLTSNGTVELVPDVPSGPTLMIPIIAAGTQRAALLAVRDVGSPPFTSADVVAGEGLAGQAALAFELERARMDRERIVLVGDRERIARDLHDHVIQQLFAIGMYLQGALPFIDQDTASERVSDAIDELDNTIREIRNTIYGLLRPASDQPPLRAQLIDLVRTYEETLGFSPALRLEGPIDTAVPPEMVPHVVAVVREALSNIARHASASAASVEVSVVGGTLAVEVTDDGVGIKAPQRSSGLSNLEERAGELGGSFEVASPAAGGTRLEWSAPLES